MDREPQITADSALVNDASSTGFSQDTRVVTSGEDSLPPPAAP